MDVLRAELPAKTRVVAIDPGKAKHRVLLADGERGLIGESVSLPTLREGIERLCALIAREAAPKTVIAIEATGSGIHSHGDGLVRRCLSSRPPVLMVGSSLLWSEEDAARARSVRLWDALSGMRYDIRCWGSGSNLHLCDIPLPVALLQLETACLPRGQLRDWELARQCRDPPIETRETNFACRTLRPTYAKGLRNTMQRTPRPPAAE